MISFLFFAFAVTSATALVLNVPNPVPEQIDGEWTVIPDEEGKLYMINVQSAMIEPQPFFNVQTGVLFELYTLRNPRNVQYLRINDVESLANSYFDASRPTRIVIHGFNSKGDLTVAFQRAYFIDGHHDVNYIAVNWEAGSNTINYISARRRVNVVGPQVSRFIEFLQKFAHLNLEDVIVIGHSLGAHIAGLSGKHLGTGQLPKIIGLDPANPLFSMGSPNERIAVGDARSVETIVTNGGGLGFSAPLGDGNFYPNGGRSQPGCGWDLAGTCAHSRAHEFYLESLNSIYHFYSDNCLSYDEIRSGRCTTTGEQLRMGGDPGNQGDAQGVFFVDTNNSPPFARGRRN